MFFFFLNFLFEFFCQAECYHYLFDAAIRLYQLGLDWSTPSHGPICGVRGDSKNTNGVVKLGVPNENHEVLPSSVSSYILTFFSCIPDSSFFISYKKKKNESVLLISFLCQALLGAVIIWGSINYQTSAIGSPSFLSFPVWLFYYLLGIIV